MFYTYAHCRPDGSIFYIGKGQRKRAWDVVNRSKVWKEYVKKLGNYEVKILSKWQTEKDAFYHEILLISCFKDLKIELINVANGGQGASGYKHKEETILKMKEIHSGENNHFFGKLHSEESKKLISETKKANPSRPWLGKPRSEDTRRKIAESLRGKPGKKHTEESKHKISLAHMGKKQLSPSEQTRKKLSEAVKKSWVIRKQQMKGN